MGLRLAIVTDVHNGPDTGNVRGPEAIALLEQFVREAAPLEPDLVIDLGDRITDQSPELDRQNFLAVRDALLRFSCPKVHLLGNHDAIPREEQARELNADLGSHAVELNGWNLVFLDSYDGTTGGRIFHHTLEFLEANLTQTALPTVIFSHQPLHGQPMTGNQYFESDFAAFACPADNDKARAIIEGCALVRLCVSGHAHWNDVRHVSGVTYLTLQSLTESWATRGLAAGAWTWLELEDAIRVFVHGRAPLTLEFALQTL